MTATDDHDDATIPGARRRAMPERIGRYELGDRLGKGGMGVVYRARDTQLDRAVAVKMLLTDVADVEETRERFIREARAAAELTHRNIIKIFDFGEERGRAFIVMELLVGQSLAERLKGGTPVPLDTALEIMKGVAAGLAFAHSKAIVHRDLTPGNLFLPEDGPVKILDFGLARIASSTLTRSGLVFGTPDYMSPEQVRGKVVDHRSDIFSVGAVFYHLASGRKPFAAGSLPLVMRKVVDQDPPPLSHVPSSLARIIGKALQKAPVARYQQTEALLADLGSVGATPIAGAPEPTEDEATVVLRQLGRYEVLERVGHGATGIVYRARDPVLGRDVAIKSIVGDLTADEATAAQFEREARAAARLQHANIITIYELGESESSPYIVMEFLGGMDLEGLMRDRPRFPLIKKLDLVLQLCAGLGFAHAQGVVHRDIKPSNVRVLDDGSVKLLDFGIAKLSRSDPTFSDLAGSVAFMSPEQLEGSGVDARSDIFAVGAVMYELFGGRPPFVGDSSAATAYQVLNDDPAPLRSLVAELPETLEALVVRALEKHPDQRFQTTQELASELDQIRRTLERPERRELADLDLRAQEAKVAGTVQANLSLRREREPAVAAPPRRAAQPVSQRRVVILGGGFGGAFTAMHLERRLRGRTNVDVTLVCRENYLVFQPLLPEVVSASIGIVDTIAPLRRLCPRTTLYTRQISHVDLAQRTVTLEPGVRLRPVELPFDHLVLALGNVPAFGRMPGLQQHAMPFKNIGDALHLRNHVLHLLEEAAVEPAQDVRRTLTTFVVAGGGFSGVEVAAELNDFVREIVRDYKGLDPNEVRVVLVHSGERILPELADRLGAFAQRVLTKRGVEIRLKSRLASATATAAILTSGERIATRTLVSTVPVGPNPIVASLSVPRDRNRVVVDHHLAVPGHEGLWALGDCAAARDAVTGAPVPPTAQHAIREARCVAENIVAAVDGGQPRAFSFPGLGKLASLGRRTAVAEVLGVQLSGLVAWWLWRTVYLMKLPGFDRKLRVAADWTLDLFLRQDIVQLKTERSRPINYEHFGAGEVVIRQGDVGDKLYVIQSGEAGVFRAVADGEPTQVAVHKPGAYFGEMALLSDAPRNATVKALTPLDVLAVAREDFLTLVGSFPELRVVFEGLVRERAIADDTLPPSARGEPH